MQVLTLYLLWYTSGSWAGVGHDCTKSEYWVRNRAAAAGRAQASKLGSANAGSRSRMDCTCCLSTRIRRGRLGSIRLKVVTGVRLGLHGWLGACTAC
ncbi:hypothetical protein V8C86DRAFT_2477526 [Haematococcus lacustris]